MSSWPCYIAGAGAMAAVFCFMDLHVWRGMFWVLVMIGAAIADGYLAQRS